MIPFANSLFSSLNPSGKHASLNRKQLAASVNPLKCSNFCISIGYKRFLKF